MGTLEDILPVHERRRTVSMGGAVDSGTIAGGASTIMTTDDSGRPREDGLLPDDAGGRRPTGSESPREVGEQALRGLFAVVFGRILFFQSFIWLLLGAGLLTGAWALARQEMDRRDALVTFSGRAPGTVEAPRWRLDFDPEILGDGTNWLAVTTAQACARLRFRPDGGEERVAGRRRPLPPPPGGVVEAAAAGDGGLPA